MHFYCKKTTCGQKPGPRGLIDPPGAEDVKRKGCGKFSRGFNSINPSVKSHPVNRVIKN